MTTEAQLDVLQEQIDAGNYDAVRPAFVAGFDTVFFDLMARNSVRGSKPKTIENLDVSESWDLTSTSVNFFGAGSTYVRAVPSADDVVVTLPVNDVFATKRGYRWTVENASLAFRMVLAASASVVDGAASVVVMPGEIIELLYTGAPGDELVSVNGPWTRTRRVDLATSDAAGGLAAVQNTTGHDLIASAMVRVFTPVVGLAADVGVSASSSSSSDTLMDGVPLSSAGVRSSYDDGGASGRALRLWPAGEWVTASTSSGASAGLVARLLVEWRMA